jgi:hypothetical protein
MYANAFYPNYFNGFCHKLTVDYTPVRGYTFSDDLTGKMFRRILKALCPPHEDLLRKRQHGWELILAQTGILPGFESQML